jgi:hypothetical protein
MAIKVAEYELIVAVGEAGMGVEVGEGGIVFVSAGARDAKAVGEGMICTCPAGVGTATVGVEMAWLNALHATEVNTSINTTGINFIIFFISFPFWTLPASSIGGQA